MRVFAERITYKSIITEEFKYLVQSLGLEQFFYIICLKPLVRRLVKSLSVV